MVNKTIILICLHCLSLSASGQTDTTRTANPDPKKIWIATGTHAVLWTGSYVALNKAWYAEYPKEKFHFFNDNREWNQMDKAGHVWSAYHLSSASARLWSWSGINHKTAAILGATSGMLYQGVIEMQDGYSADWGFSWGDVGANAVGAGLFLSQQLGWKDQRLTVKMSYWPKQYDGDLAKRRHDLFGSTLPEQVLKDYNSQTYWLSANLHSFLPHLNVPRWLNIAVGYGADGMYGGRSNTWLDVEGVLHIYEHIERKRMYFLSADIDLSRIRTTSPLLKTVLNVLNIIKIPAPALEISNKGKLRFHAIKF